MLPIAPDTLLQQRYRILNLLEDGELGRTYLATDSGRADAYCVLIEISSTSQSSATAAVAKEVFNREVTPLYQLQHPQIPRFWTTFEEQNRLFLVRDYVAGKTYAQLLAARRDLGTVFTEAEVWQFLVRVLPAIGYVHSKGTIHQDLSLAHIIERDRDRLPVLSDFGAVKVFVNQLHAPNGHQLAIGQPGYAPIDQIRSGQISPSTDLYAIAVAAIVLLTGKEPTALFAGERIDWNWRKWTQIGDEMAAILSRMLSLEPPDRYQSALAVSRDLQAIDPHQSRSIPSADPEHHPSTLPTIAVGGGNRPPTPVPQTAITNVDGKSMWEQPKVFIPAGIAIALLAGIGSWIGVSHLLHRSSTDPVVTTPPKQVDFNNPTIPTDGGSPTATVDPEVIQPELDRSIVKEGTIDADTPVRYRVAVLAGQNLDIQLVPTVATTTDPTKTNSPADPAAPLSSPIDPLNPSPTRSTTNTSTNPPISLPNSTPATQVLMTILSPTGTPIDDKSNRVVGWRGQIPTAGDYTIELRPIKGIKGSAFPYKLSVTQVAVTPSPIPTATTAPNPVPDTPVPVEGNGIAPIPTNPTAPTNNIPGAIVPSPTVAPTPTESPRPRKRRRRIQVEPSPQVQRDRTESSTETPTRRRRQVESSEDNPTPRRRRRQVESSEDNPTPRRRRQVESSEDNPTPRRRRQAESAQPEPSSTSSPSTPEGGSKIPVPEPSVAIPVPNAKSATPQRGRTDSNNPSSPGGNNVDPD